MGVRGGSDWKSREGVLVGGQRATGLGWGASGDNSGHSGGMGARRVESEGLPSLAAADQTPC